MKSLRKVAGPWLDVIHIFTNQLNTAVIMYAVISEAIPDLISLNTRFNFDILGFSFQMESFRCTYANRTRDTLSFNYVPSSITAVNRWNYNKVEEKNS